MRKQDMDEVQVGDILVTTSRCKGNADIECRVLKVDYEERLGFWVRVIDQSRPFKDHGKDVYERFLSYYAVELVF